MRESAWPIIGRCQIAYRGRSLPCGSRCEQRDSWRGGMKVVRVTTRPPSCRLVVFRVPKACPNGARLAFWAFFQLSKINKLRVFNGPTEFNSPLQHHIPPLKLDNS